MVYTPPHSQPRYVSDSEDMDLWFAAKNGNYELLQECCENKEYFNEYLDMGYKFNGDIYTPLQIAIAHRKTEAALFLIEHGAKLGCTMGKGVTLLHMTIQCKLLRVARELLRQGVKIDTRNDLGQTPLYLAVWNNNQEFVKLFMKYHANPNALDMNNTTPMSIAKLRKNGEALECMQLDFTDIY